MVFHMRKLQNNVTKCRFAAENSTENAEYGMPVADQ